MIIFSSLLFILRSLHTQHTRDIVWVDDDHVLTASGAKVYTHSLRVYSSIVAHVLTLSSSCHVSYKVADVNRKVRECALNTPVDGPTKVAGFITATTILNTTTSVRLFLFFGLCVCRSFFLSIFVSVLFFSLSLSAFLTLFRPVLIAVVTFPDFHRVRFSILPSQHCSLRISYFTLSSHTTRKDAIREVAVNHINKNLIISGGFDGNVRIFFSLSLSSFRLLPLFSPSSLRQPVQVFVTDISKLLGDISKNEARSENSLYACRYLSLSVTACVQLLTAFSEK